MIVHEEREKKKPKTIRFAPSQFKSYKEAYKLLGLNSLSKYVRKACNLLRDITLLAREDPPNKEARIVLDFLKKNKISSYKD